MLSYQADMTIANNPYELGMGRLVDLDMDADFVSKHALTKIHAAGVTKRQAGLEIAGEPLAASNDFFWPILRNDQQVGKVTSAIYSPRLKKNIALAMLDIEHAELGTDLTVDAAGDARSCAVVPTPFYDPKKTLATAS